MFEEPDIRKLSVDARVAEEIRRGFHPGAEKTRIDAWRRAPVAVVAGRGVEKLTLTLD